MRFLTNINVSVNGGFLQSVGVLWHFTAKNNCPLDLDLEYVDCRGQFLQEIEGPMCVVWCIMEVYVARYGEYTGAYVAAQA